MMEPPGRQEVHSLGRGGPLGKAMLGLEGPPGCAAECGP